MPSKRLLCCGLLSKYPEKSSIKQRLQSSRSFTFTEDQIKQIVALYYTPGLSKSWIDWQFVKQGHKPDLILRKIRRIAQNPKNRQKYEHLGWENLDYIGPEEVQRYYDRRKPTGQTTHPNWAIAVILDYIKKGMTQAQIAEMYNLNSSQISKLTRKNLFQPTKHKGQPSWPKWKRKETKNDYHF